ncbi:EBNA1 binding protein 2 nucleolar protein p40 [Cryptosporidium ubiquitum]|uniref:EBNA1 binding protein 2 nucleolar protein p40 n=1 Tax=Cryptosporidium ubiquitum TaxID=857276 RepID=A0A1J4MG60_9CRYT|nr:EBNA1 binding protein 2 nucleolar protein p40 [Cryptosporidium ubiquitum]OII73242.1 EBNA1 binding protein 2 nucleolar protein p40 [Cryptosporidium ubiquitum]
MSDSDSELETRVLEDNHGGRINVGGESKLVLDKEGIQRKIAALDYKTQLGMNTVPFIETLALVDKEGSKEKIDFKDSTKRESYFYSNTLRNVNRGCKILASMNVKWNRPDDMLAEMLKTDQHMKKIKMDLLKQEQKIKAVELKKQKYVEKKFNKKIQVEKKKLRKQETKKNLREIENWKKSDHKNSASIEESFDKYFSKNTKQSNLNKNKKTSKQSIKTVNTMKAMNSNKSTKRGRK